MKPAIKLYADVQNTVRVFSMTVSDTVIDEISPAHSKDERNTKCKELVVSTFKECIKSAFHAHSLVTEWFLGRQKGRAS